MIDHDFCTRVFFKANIGFWRVVKSKAAKKKKVIYLIKGIRYFKNICAGPWFVDERRESRMQTKILISALKILKTAEVYDRGTSTHRLFMP